MKHKLYYSILKYTPDIIRDESLNVGIVFHCPDIPISKFKKTNNKQRIYYFDDEYDPDYIDIVFKSLSYEFDSDNLNLDNDDRFEFIKNDNYLEEKTKPYVNEFWFSKVFQIEISEPLKEEINDLTKTYLYYDSPKNQRITVDKVNALLKKQIKNTDAHLTNVYCKIFSKNNKKPVFTIETKNSVVAPFTFDYKKDSSLDNALEKLSFQVTHVKNKLKNKNIQIVINNIDLDDSKYKEKMNLLKDVLSEDTGMEVKIDTLADFSEKIKE
ncbi:DUF3037 domain-containing protein [Fructilactobacillus myrtifloralis]|uniref:DUF3037 domain-containing protein n=1 Tax=Fructilactobacillus myrtifloralis TaxID=2940301 RepID=A0ABY5BPF6_9LACO|nr:DUF3037 domain-containing protein [Fructilactobacillus myrtifloralis]USS84967.1 DUF3037 domain-containing protein [Fructilactobacillus myrtifloralis]